MKGWVAIFTLVMMLAAMSVSAADFRVAFIGDEAAFGEHNTPAAEWAQAEFSASLVDPGDLTSTDLTQYAVLWWHEGDNDPGALDGAVVDALLEYLEAGGTLLLSAATERYASDLGIESGQPRTYGPGNDAQLAGVSIREDSLDHPVWEGFDRQIGTEIETTSVGYPKSSDYYDSQLADGVTIGDCWETGSAYGDRVGAFVEWDAGKGKVFGMGWRIAHFKDDNKDIETLQQLTRNVIEYLGQLSAFAPVEARGKLTLTWGQIKR